MGSKAPVCSCCNCDSPAPTCWLYSRNGAPGGEARRPTLRDMILPPTTPAIHSLMICLNLWRLNISVKVKPPMLPVRFNKLQASPDFSQVYGTSPKSPDSISRARTFVTGLHQRGRIQLHI